MAARAPDVVGWPLDEALAALEAGGWRWLLRRTAFPGGPPPGGDVRVLALRAGGDGAAAVDVEVVAAAFPAPAAARGGGAGAGAREGR